MKSTLLIRPQFCPIGVQSNVRTLPATFSKLCKHHQSRVVTGGEPGKESISIIHQSACASCPVGKHILRGEDPTVVVGDIGWITLDELQVFRSRMTTVAKAIEEISRVSEGSMKDDLVEIQKLLQQVDVLLDKVLKQLPDHEKESTSVVKASSIKMSPKRVQLAKELHSLSKKGVTRQELGTRFKLSTKYVSALIRAYESSI